MAEDGGLAGVSAERDFDGLAVFPSGIDLESAAGADAFDAADWPVRGQGGEDLKDEVAFFIAEAGLEE